MDNQHRKIKGYRELNEQEVQLMNEVKEHAQATKELIARIKDLRTAQELDDIANGQTTISTNQLNESDRCTDLATDNLQQGYMWLVRSVALPNSF